MLNKPNQEESEQKEDQEIIQPSAVTRHGFMVDFEAKDLDHSRRTLWKWMLSYISPFRREFLLYLVLLLVGTLITAITPAISARIIDHGIIREDAYYVLLMSIIYLSLMVIMAITTYFSQYGMGKLSQSITFDIRNDLFFKLQDMSLTYFDRKSSGDIMSITTNDVTILNQLVGGQFVQIISSIVLIISTISIMFFLNPFLALISLPIFPFFLLIAWFFRKVATGLFKESRRTISKVTSSIQENIAGAKVVQAYGQEGKASNEFDTANTANYNAMVRIRRYMATIFPLINLITTILTASILLAGGYALLGNVSIFGLAVTPGVLTAYVVYLGQFFRPFMTLMQIEQVIQSSMAASDRIYSLLQEEGEIPDSPNPKFFNEVNGTIEFSDVSFGYLLDNVGKDDVENSNKPFTFTQNRMIRNPMMRQGFKLIESLPKPYSSFIFQNIMHMPDNIRHELMFNIMKSELSEIPKKIDEILGEFKYAIPNTEFSKNHPDYKTSFESKSLEGQDGKEGQLIPFFSMEQMIPPEGILMMVKFLERSLRSNTSIQQSGGMGGEGESMMSNGMSRMSLKSMIEMLANISIPPEIEEKIPNIVQDAINEQKILLQYKQSKGYVLKNLFLNVPKGITLAIVGETGAGKTTLIKLIARFYDVNSGKILIDGIDIREVPKKDLRDQIGLVPQDAFLFTGTIKENLLYAFENPTPEDEAKMIEVSKFLGLHNFIDTLHKKYDTKLKENASNISIGQRQLIAFARALITDPKILILDEATSSVDPYTETLIQDALNKARKGRTTIIIAHRLSTIKNADLIVVLSGDKRGIVEEGDHESLLSLNGKYKRLLEMQHRNVEMDN
ncbi:MAG: ABC transporter ATP-binding protein [Candidatus Thorarchaeota archaeon]